MNDEPQPQTNPQPRPRLLGLPAELRNQVWRLVVAPEANRVRDADGWDAYAFDGAMALLRVNRQVHAEAGAAFRALNVFVRIEMPWGEDDDLIAERGRVPFVLRGDPAARFAMHSLDVRMECPLDEEDEEEGGFEDSHFVIVLDDLPLYAKEFFYHDLSEGGVNRFLGLFLHVRDPHTAAGEDGAEDHLTPDLQRRLLLPFAWFKDLREMIVTGDPAPIPAIEAELRLAQAVPTPSPRWCLHEGMRLKLAGDALLRPDIPLVVPGTEDPQQSVSMVTGNGGDPRGALEAYGRAWEAIHVEVNGRWMYVHGERFYSPYTRLAGEGPPGTGQGESNGMAVRFMVRIQLVANICLAYLKLRLWDEVVVWGMRTICMMRWSRIRGMHQGDAHLFGEGNLEQDNEGMEAEYFANYVSPQEESVAWFNDIRGPSESYLIRLTTPFAPLPGFSSFLSRSVISLSAPTTTTTKER